MALRDRRPPAAVGMSIRTETRQAAGAFTIAAQMKPRSSRASAIAATGLGFPRARSRLNRR